MIISLSNQEILFAEPIYYGEKNVLNLLCYFSYINDKYCNGYRSSTCREAAVSRTTIWGTTLL
jgi:hypothetical protein